MLFMSHVIFPFTNRLHHWYIYTFECFLPTQLRGCPSLLARCLLHFLCNLRFTEAQTSFIIWSGKQRCTKMQFQRPESQMCAIIFIFIIVWHSTYIMSMHGVTSFGRYLSHLPQNEWEKRTTETGIGWMNWIGNNEANVMLMHSLVCLSIIANCNKCTQMWTVWGPTVEPINLFELSVH